MTTPPPEQPHSSRIVAGVLVGAISGFVLGAVIYFVLSPVLESQSGVLREMQGFAFNLVPGLAVIGGALGAWWGIRRR